MFKRAKVVMLPTNEKAFLTLFDNNRLLISVSTISNVKEFVNQHLYIIDDEITDDEIKDSDWCIKNYGMGQEIVQYHKDYGNQCKKIIATTNSSLWEHDDTVPYPKTRPALPQPSQSFIEKYVEEYNKGQQITDILVVEILTKIE